MLCVSEMAEPLSSDSLAQMLSSGSPPSDVIIIDCRPFLVMTTSRIKGANDVHCPPIVKRRSGGNIPLENILRDSKTREAFLMRRFSCIVVYDDNTKCLKGLAKDSNMCLVIKTLREERGVEDIYFLKGGFQQFHTVHPHLCTTSSASSTTSSSASASMSSLSSSHFLSIPTTVSSHGDIHAYQASFPILREPKRCHSGNSDSEGPSEVLPWLYIGNLYHALNIDHLLSLGVTMLINMAGSTETSPLPSPHFCYKNIPVRDSCSADILQWFPEVIDYIETTRKKKGKVLVHCQAGISRSATVCIAYLMYYKGYDLEQAFDFLKAKRTVVSPNLNFMRQLTEFQTQLKDGTTGLRQRSAPPMSPKLTLGLLGDSHECSGSSALGLLGEGHVCTTSSLSLTLTPCIQQAASSFAFDLPFAPSTTSACSPTIPIQSPLMSPS